MQHGLTWHLSSQRPSTHANHAQRATLQFFDAPEEEYIVVFTSSATASLKLVGESFPFATRSKLLLPVDAHNSLHGIRSFATSKGAEVLYMESPSEGGIFLEQVKVPNASKCLFAFLIS
jgi:molybdenum cofactor sulfurtransferase